MSTPTRTTKKPIRSPNIWVQLALLLLSPLAFFAVLEGIAYLWESHQAKSVYAWEMVASRRIDLIPTDSGGSGYTIMKPGSHYEWREITVDINSKGLRNPEMAYQKPENTYRILNLGDSVVMGWGVRLEETYGQQLAHLLNQQGESSMNFEVINAGVPGWNLENALAYLQDEGVKYEPDLILLDITIVNDINGKNALHNQNRSSAVEWLRSHTYFWPFLTIQMQWVQARLNGRDRIDVIDPPLPPSKYFPADPGAAAWARIWDLVTAINQVAVSNGAQFMVLLFPIEFQVLDDTYPELPQQIFNAKSSEADINVIDLLPAYRQACLQKPGGACSLHDHYLFADVWMHPSKVGNAITTSQIMTFLDGSMSSINEENRNGRNYPNSQILYSE